jgi:hypothetical protein
MYCPQCGQQQASSEMRFCSRCGFPLAGVSELLASGGVLKSSGGEELREESLAPRRRGVKQGVLLLVRFLLIINYNQHQTTLLEIFVAISAVIFFAGGLMRILYARLFESAAPALKSDSPAQATPTVPAQLNTGARVSTLPPAQSTPVPSFMPRRVNTAELAQPPSVTENTTRLLDEEKTTRSE